MKVKNKILTIMVAGVALSTLIIPNKANAALQSNGGTPASKSIEEWILQIRQMQELGGTLGRTDTVSTTDLRSNVTDLDIHMEKNAEYGAMAILSASAYGNPNKINDGETTTGNSTGIVININSELVSAGPISESRLYKNVLQRYKDDYPSPFQAKNGDAILETKGWHGSSESSWLYNYTGSSLLRSYAGSLFSYNGSSYHPNYMNYGNKNKSRACIVVGTGL